MSANQQSEVRTAQRSPRCAARRVLARTADYLSSNQPQAETQVDCAECEGTGEGHWDTACGACRGRGYFGSRS